MNEELKFLNILFPSQKNMKQGFDSDKTKSENYNQKQSEDLDFFRNFINKYNNDICAKKDTDSYKGFTMKNLDNRSGVELTYLLPGLTKKDISVSFTKNICNVSSEKDVPYFGKINSTVSMKFDVDFDKTTAKMENGILVICVFKKVLEQDKERKISVN